MSYGRNEGAEDRPEDGRESQEPHGPPRSTEIPSEGEYRTAISAVLQRLGLPERWSEPFARHARLVAETNLGLNLTRLISPAEVAELQVEDSIGIAGCLPLAGAHVLDLGTGAGYPGIPMAYVEPSAQVLLVDARRKKVEFLQRTLAQLERGNLEARWGRAEQVLSEVDPCDIVVARAVGSVAAVLQLLRPVRHRIGLVALAKGPRLETELEEAKSLLTPSLFRLRSVEEYALGGQDGRRWVALFEPAGRPPKAAR
ncbi:MAG: 16S rRNA (guanine(527)-N(7))-methyltransferase RsmG [Planctomycetes bacterium]|nr:16S rRNA (guanine(527)-N(7))-methyltransferase RsmG [Planctomycetota bacterium]